MPSPPGELNHAAKLYAVDIPVIRRLAREGTSQRELGRRFRVSHKAIGKVLNRQTWTHIPEEALSGHQS